MLDLVIETQVGFAEGCANRLMMRYKVQGHPQLEEIPSVSVLRYRASGNTNTSAALDMGFTRLPEYPSFMREVALATMHSDRQGRSRYTDKSVALDGQRIILPTVAMHFIV